MQPQSSSRHVRRPRARRRGSLLGHPGTVTAGFFDACLAPGSQIINVYQDTVVRNETATFLGSAPDSCRVELAAGVDLALVNVTVQAEKYLSFSNAKVASVCRNDMTTGHTAISSGGKTAVRHNDISGTSSLSGLPCISVGNSPGVVCASTCRGQSC